MATSNVQSVRTHPKGTKLGVGDSLEAMLVGRVQVAADLLADINSSISSRHLTSSKFLEAVDEQYICVKSKLLELQVWPIATSQPIDQRRGALERELDALTRDKRHEMIVSWQDIADLKREFRFWKDPSQDYLIQ